jgi:hypothetical protein
LATWEDFEPFIDKFQAFQLEDELAVEGGRDVMCGRARDGRRDAERATAAVLGAITTQAELAGSASG